MERKDKKTKKRKEKERSPWGVKLEKIEMNNDYTLI